MNTTTVMPNITSTGVPLTTTLSSTSTSLECPSLFNNNYKAIYFCNMSYDAAILGLISLLLTILNIVCICVMGVLVLRVSL